MTAKQVAAVAFLCIIAGLTVGVLLQKYFGIGRVVRPILNGTDRNTPAVSDSARSESKIEAPLAAIRSKKRVMVALVFGQSGAANAGETPRIATRDVYNFYKGKLYRAQDPLLGATGNGGSVWTRLGDKLIERQFYDAVVFVPIAVAGSTISRWRPGGDLHKSMLTSFMMRKIMG
jgi:hypothetical protein